jgi:hypothetical protein
MTLLISAWLQRLLLKTKNSWVLVAEIRRQRSGRSRYKISPGK